MIKVNLSGAPKTKNGRSPVDETPSPSRAIPLLLVLIFLGTAAGGYLWYANLKAQTDDLDKQLVVLKAERDRLAAVIKQERVYEARKKALESRISVIEGLKRGQVSPVRSLDILDDAIDRTHFVWLSNLDQNNAIFSMAGTGTSVNAIADFVSNLEATGYFRKINLQNAQDSAGNYTFSMTCEFTLPASQTKGAN
jgi:type IV pilus assembly protein PilN